MINYPVGVPVPRRLSWMQVGCGRGSFINGPWLDALRETDQLALNWAVPSRSPARCLDFMRQARLPQGRVGYDLERTLMLAMQAEEGLRPDVVGITTPTGAHADQIIACAEAGVKYIVCDKPVVTSWEEYQRVAAAVKAAGAKVFVTFNHRFMAPVFALQQLAGVAMVKEHNLSVEAWFLQSWLLNDPHIRQSDWRLSHPWCGLLDIGTHWFDLAQFVLHIKPLKLGDAVLGTAGQHGHNVFDNGTCTVIFQDIHRAYEPVACQGQFHQALPGHQDDIGIKIIDINGLQTYMWRLEWGADALWTADGTPGKNDRGAWRQVLRGTDTFPAEVNAAFGKTPPGHVLGWPDAWYHLFASVAGAVYTDLGLIDVKNLPPCMKLPLPTLEDAGRDTTLFAEAFVLSKQIGQSVDLTPEGIAAAQSAALAATKTRFKA